MRSFHANNIGAHWRRALAKTPGTGPGSTGRKAQPIASLNPYMSGWTIKARIATKDSLRSFSRGSETISVFTCELVDEQVILASPPMTAVDKRHCIADL